MVCQIVLVPVVMSIFGIWALVRSLRATNPHECSLWLVLALLFAPLGLLQFIPLLVGFLRSVGLSPF
jgi:hypothetical protein